MFTAEAASVQQMESKQTVRGVQSFILAMSINQVSALGQVSVSKKRTGLKIFF